MRTADAIDEARSHLTEIVDALGRLEGARLDLVDRVDEDARDQLAAVGAVIRTIEDDLTGEIRELDRASARFRRGTLNVGVVGRARQGKSRFLQTLTGLTDREIPSGNRQYCTGVPSHIQCAVDTPTYAEVFFHTERSFIAEVLAGYYDRLGLGPAPRTLDAFARDPLAPPAHLSSALERSLFDNLVRYRETLAEYRPLLAARSPRRIEPAEIRRFVAQDDEGGARHNEYRAVRQVRITTVFPTPELSGLAVIDLPGLGDTNLGDERLLLSALRDDVDLVVFVRRPDHLGDSIQDVDVKLYDTTRDALPEIPLDLWSFMVVNRVTGDADNLLNANAFRELLRGSRIGLVDAFVADCSNAGAVLGAFDAMVSYLLKAVDELDAHFLAPRAQRFAEILEQLRMLVGEADRLASYAQPSAEWFHLFTALFQQTRERLAVGLEGLVREMRRERDVPDVDLMNAVEEVLHKAREDTGIPDEVVIGNRRDVRGSYQVVYGELLDEVRARLSAYFLGLGEVLVARAEEAKRRVADVLRGDGMLGEVIPTPGREFLLALADRVPPQVRKDGPSEIVHGLRLLGEFALPYRGFIQHRIRPCLDGLDPDNPGMPWPDSLPADPAGALREMLQVVHEEALFKCESALEDLAAEPNRAIFAVVEEFRDRVLRSQGVDTEWLIFYQNVRAEVWAGRFAALAENAELFRRWTEDVAALNQLASRRSGLGGALGGGLGTTGAGSA